MNFFLHVKSQVSAERKDERKKRDVVLPFEPHSLAFDDVKYSVEMPQVNEISILEILRKCTY